MRDDFLAKLRAHVNFIPICPEVAIGLGVPRFPVRIVSGRDRVRLVQPATDKDLTNEMKHFSERFLATLTDVDGFILKSRSPSCGTKDVRICSKTEKSPPAEREAGIFGNEVTARFPNIAVEDEGRLKSLGIREHFLTKLFMLASFREMTKQRHMAELVRFHTENKFPA